MAEEKAVGFNIDKEKNFSEWLLEVIKQAELADQRYNVKGFIVHRPNAAVTEKVMYRIYEEALESRGHRPARFPSVIPESNFTLEAEHVKGFVPGVFWVTHAGKESVGLEEKLALRPTSETAMYRMYALWVRSWRDLPLRIYQSCQVWRYETKATHPFLRDREFYWIEAHDAFATREEAEAQVLQDMETTEEVMHQRFGIPFLFFKRPDWDRFPGAVHTFGSDALMPDGKMIQLPSTHFLGQNFAKPFNIRYIDKDEKEKHVWQTCYGPAISRIYVALLATHGDDKGLVLPYELAPVQVVIVPIPGKADNAAITKKCAELRKKLQGRCRVELDDSDSQPGAKFYYWELRGVPLRIEVGAKEVEAGTLTVARRDTGKREKIKEGELHDYLARVPEEILANLRSRADKKFAGCIHEAKSLNEAKAVLDRGGLCRVMFCSRERDGEACADRVKEATEGGEVRGTLHSKQERASGSCVACGKPAKEVVYIARAY